MISVVIPTLNAEPWLAGLFAALARQQPCPPDEIIMVDSGSRDGTVARAAENPVVRVVPLASFTHGGARNLGVKEARGEWVVLMTQDACPADEHWLARLLEPLHDDSVAAVYSRQIPRDKVSPMERFFLVDRFPAGAAVVRRHTGSDVPVYPATFFSNVSAAARRATWLRFPFNETLLMSEDQQFARDVLLAGLAVVYEPASVVVHSHDYNLRQTFSRYFDSVVAFRQLSAGHDAATSARLGRETVWREFRYLLRGYPRSLPYYVFYQIAKAAGVMAGHFHERLPRSWCERMSMNPSWWRRVEEGRHGH